MRAHELQVARWVERAGGTPRISPRALVRACAFDVVPGSLVARRRRRRFLGVAESSVAQSRTAVPGTQCFGQSRGRWSASLLDTEATAARRPRVRKLRLLLTLRPDVGARAPCAACEQRVARGLDRVQAVAQGHQIWIGVLSARRGGRGSRFASERAGRLAPRRGLSPSAQPRTEANPKTGPPSLLRSLQSGSPSTRLLIEYPASVPQLRTSRIYITRDCQLCLWFLSFLPHPRRGRGQHPATAPRSSPRASNPARARR